MIASKEKKIKEKLYKVIYGLVALIVMIFVSYIIYNNAIKTFMIETDEELKFYLLIIASILIVCLTIFYIFNFLNKVFKEKSEKHKKLLTYFLVYFGIMLGFILMTWPGIFKGDEFILLRMNSFLKIELIQHYLTNFFYIICRMIIPNIAGIVIILNIVISSIVSYIMYNIEKRIEHKKLVWLLLIPLLFFPVIDNNLFPLRNSIVTYIFLVIMLKLIWLFKDNNISKKDIITLVILTALISALKTEFIYVVPIVALIFLILYKIKFRKVILGLACTLILMEIINIPQKDENNNTYILTAVLNPLQNILASKEINSPNLEEDLKNIDAIIDHNLLVQKASYTNIPAYFGDGVKWVSTFEEKINFIKSSLRLFIYNFDTFLQSRWETFKYTTGLVPDYINHTGHEDASWTLDLNYINFDRLVFNNSPKFLNYELRKDVISILNCRNINDYNKTNFLHQIIYNVIPQIIILLGILICSIIKKNKLYLWISLLCLLQFPIIFLTAPAAFWMYYMPLYMSANILIFYILIQFIDTRKHNDLLKSRGQAE